MTSGAGMGGWEVYANLERVLKSFEKETPLPPAPSGPRDLPTYYNMFRDPEGRFELQYPSDWSLDRESGTVSSSRLKSFAQVKVLPKASLAPDPTRHIHGTCEVSGIHFDVDFYAWEGSSERVLLILGNVVDPSRSRLVEKWEDTTLETIRRYFVAAPK